MILMLADAPANIDPPSLPDPAALKTYHDLGPFVSLVKNQYGERMNALLEDPVIGPDLRRAWNEICNSASPGTVQIGGGRDIDNGRRLMLLDIKSAMETGNLTTVDEGETKAERACEPAF